MPNQVDLRFKAYEDPGFRTVLRSLYDDPRLLHWYGTNFDALWPKMIPIPLGFWEPGGTELLCRVLREEPGPPLGQRRLKAFCANRVRQGAQWAGRRMVSQKALGEWRDCVDHYESVAPDAFFDTISRYPFVICVGGGGLDPSPKAWTALLAGAIPIIERNPTTEAYADLPVIFVDSWDSLELNQERLRRWRDELAPRFEDPAARSSVLLQLSMGYWLERMGRSH